MILDGKKECDDTKIAIGFAGLLLQGIATSIDALSVGFTIAHMKFYEALICCLIIASITFVICFIGVYIGKIFGNKFNCKVNAHIDIGYICSFARCVDVSCRN